MTLEYQTLKGMLERHDNILAGSKTNKTESSDESGPYEMAKIFYSNKKSLKKPEIAQLLSEMNLISLDSEIIEDNLFTASGKFNISFEDNEREEFCTLLMGLKKFWKTIQLIKHQFSEEETSKYLSDYPFFNIPASKITTILENLNKADDLALQLNIKPLEPKTSTEAAESAPLVQQQQQEAAQPLPQIELPSSPKIEDNVFRRKNDSARDPKRVSSIYEMFQQIKQSTDDWAITATTTAQSGDVTSDTPPTEKPTIKEKPKAEDAITEEIKIQQSILPTKPTAQPAKVTTDKAARETADVAVQKSEITGTTASQTHAGAEPTTSVAAPAQPQQPARVATGKGAPKTTDVTPQKSKVTETTAAQTQAETQPPISVPVPAQPQQPAKVTTGKVAAKTADVTVQESKVTGATASQTHAGAQPTTSVPVPQQPGITGTEAQQGAPSDKPPTSDSAKKSDASKKPLPKLLRYLILGFVFVYTLGIYPLVKYRQTKKDREAVKNINEMAEGAEKTAASNKIPEDYFKRAMFSTGTNFLIKAQVGLGMQCDSTRKLIGPTLDGKIATETLRSVPRSKK